MSIAASESRALLAVGRGCRVGVDIEPLRSASGLPRLPPAWRFSPAERAHLQGLDSQEWPATIAQAWVRKEAVAKVDGRGLALPLSRIETLGTRGPIKGLPSDWLLRDVRAAADSAAAIAADRDRERRSSPMPLRLNDPVNLGDAENILLDSQ